MSFLETRLSVNNDSSPLYRVTVNDGGPDGGSSTDIVVGGFPASIDYTAAEAAVQALADAFAATAGYTLVGITRVVVAETTL